MYATHFGLRSEAFALTPDPAFLYPSPGHAEALAGLKIGLESRRGLMVMIGEVGMGKTTLLYSLLSELGAGIHTAYVSNTRLSFYDILRQALADFGVTCESRDRLTLLNALNGFLRQCAADGSTAALVIDEAQNLDDTAFENLRLLSNFETYDTKLLQIVLVGQPELELKLRQPHLRQVAERVAVRCYINPLSRAESVRYVEHRLRCAGGSSEMIAPDALALLLRKARGIPRRINILCHNAMLFAYGRGDTIVTRALVRAAVREKEGRGLVTIGPSRHRRLGLQVARRQPTQRWRPWWIAAAVVAALLALLSWVGPFTRGAMLAADDAGTGGASGEGVAERGTTERRPAAAVASLGGVPRADGTSPPAQAETARAAVAVGAAAPDTAAPAAPHLRQVLVPRGTTLKTLAREVYGDDRPELIARIKQANPQIVDPNRILAGDLLRFPSVEGDDE